ncbi:MAG: hypothetical protein IMY72_07055 [Bacteroidetes bacterium]|nr:hypothetical protein [Bacteroidota bacterium]
MKNIITILLVFFSYLCFSQNKIEQKRNVDVRDSIFIDSLKKVYCYNKKIPLKYEGPIYLALSYFPELDSSKIVFKRARIKTTLNARPTVTSLIFNKKTKRKYIVRINTSIKDSVISIDSIPLNAMIGLYGHEFSHFVDYRNKNIFGVLSRLIDYVSKKSKEKFEKEIDTNTINRGLGWQLYDWSYYVLYNSNGTKKYKYFKRRIYLEPEEIKKIITSSNTN